MEPSPLRVMEERNMNNSMELIKVGMKLNKDIISIKEELERAINYVYTLTSYTGESSREFDKRTEVVVRIIKNAIFSLDKAVEFKVEE